MPITRKRTVRFFNSQPGYPLLAEIFHPAMFPFVLFVENYLSTVPLNQTQSAAQPLARVADY